MHSWRLLARGQRPTPSADADAHECRRRVCDQGEPNGQRAGILHVLERRRSARCRRGCGRQRVRNGVCPVDGRSDHPGRLPDHPSRFGGVVSKLNTTGTALAYSTYIGGTFGVGQGIAVDAAGSAYVTGASGPPTDFPTTPGAFQPGTNYSGQSAFVTRLIRPAPPSSTPRSWDPAVASALRWIRLATPTSRDGPTSPRSRLPWAPSSGRWSTPNRVPS
jgi:hypothetical protein